MTFDRFTFQSHFWGLPLGDTITVGIVFDSLEDASTVESIELPNVGDTVEKNKIIGHVITSETTFNLKSPVKGEIKAINKRLMDDFDLLLSDPEEDGWIFKVESSEVDTSR